MTLVVCLGSFFHHFRQHVEAKRVTWAFRRQGETGLASENFFSRADHPLRLEQTKSSSLQLLRRREANYEYYDVFKAVYKSTGDIDMIRGLKENPPGIPGKFTASKSEWRFLRSFFDVTIGDINDALENAKFKETEVAAATPFPKKQEREDTMGNQIKNFPHILPVNWRKYVHKASEPIQGNPESSQLASKWTRIPGVVSFLPFLTVICVFMAWVAFRFLHHHKHCCGSPVIAK